MNTNTVTLDQDNAAEEYTKILRGRHVTNITIGDDEARTTTLTLDNGDTLTIEGNEGYMGCVNGWYHLENAYKRGNHTARIMNTHVEHSRDDNYHDGYEVYTIFVMVDGNQTQPPSPPCEATGTRRIRHRLHTHRTPGHRQQHRHQATPRVARSRQTNTSKKQEKEKHKP